MTKRPLLLIGLVALVSFLIGKHSTPDRVKIETKIETKYVERSQETKARDKDQVTTRITKPNGTIFERTRLVSSTRTEKTSAIQADTKAETVKVIENRINPVHVSLLVGVPLTELEKGFVYGAQISKTLIGPFTLGVFGFLDARLGISIGINL